uniref:Uncharacterized protein n=1 Tax=Sphaerodactylus townsendi TaxID=933632 RepID=A0ACB8F3W4_9SAUR
MEQSSLNYNTKNNDKTDLENSVMQKKIKIPKLSLNHLEETVEIADYGDEDVELRHCKILLTGKTVTRAQNFGSSAMCYTNIFSM